MLPYFGISNVGVEPANLTRSTNKPLNGYLPKKPKFCSECGVLDSLPNSEFGESLGGVC